VAAGSGGNKEREEKGGGDWRKDGREGMNRRKRRKGELRTQEVFKSRRLWLTSLHRVSEIGQLLHFLKKTPTNLAVIFGIKIVI